MADNSDSRESDNNSWVIPGSEALPVEDLGLETSQESLLHVEPSTEIPQAPTSEEKPLVSHNLDLEESKPELPSPGTQESEVTPDSHPKEEKTPGCDPAGHPLSLHATESGEPHRSEDAARPEQQRTVFIYKAGPLGDEPSSGEDSAKERDVEGLRRRKGRDAPLPGTGASRDQGRKAPGDEDAGLLQTKWVLGFLALLGLGLLAFLGVSLDVDESPVDILSAWSSSESEELQDLPAAPGPDPSDVPHLHDAKEAFTASPGDTRSLESMSALLDKLAKENQDIRLMQAELQAQKEELQALLRKTEGENQASQQESLAAENSRLTEALRREVSSLQAAQAELRLLREKLQGPAKAGSQGPRGEGPMPDLHHHHHHHQKPKHPEIERLRSLLASVQQDLARAFEKVPPGDGAKRLRMELNEMEQRLAKELDGPDKERESYKARRGKERTWHRKHEDRWPGPREEGLHGEHHAGHRIPKMADGPHHHKKHPSPQDAKPHWKSRKAKKPTEPSALWEMLAKRQYPAPPACTGVTECAQQEGLRPVEKSSFLPMVQSYLAGMGWAEHYRGLAAALGSHFGSDGVFAHDRLSFVEFLDEVEDALEDLAEFLGVSEKEVDNFEDVILGQLGAAPGGRSSQPDGGQHHAKEWNRAGHGAREDGKKFPGQPRG